MNVVDSQVWLRRVGMRLASPFEATRGEDRELLHSQTELAEPLDGPRDDDVGEDEGDEQQADDLGEPGRRHGVDGVGKRER